MEPPDKKWQYLMFAAEPYETISFKVSTPMEPPDKKWQYLLFAAEPYETIIIQGEHPPHGTPW